MEIYDWRIFSQQYKGKENIMYYKDTGVRKPLSSLDWRYTLKCTELIYLAVHTYWVITDSSLTNHSTEKDSFCSNNLLARVVLSIPRGISVPFDKHRVKCRLT